ncbi:aminoacyl-histidine dipeptidase [Azoarcus olearius]|uniref:Cytosol non-specific dipeptidase n=1 Tax=Azoarcus sp. (strain BH72) TaxID=418699 RepID=A1K4X1_AZOSB|nr:aminoacyl-histidine dipeptidase [Azoarcus olearius]CAL93876.1 probable aminoacyl-histidine dipeptidase [Azoarcus olearius]
MDLNLLPPAAVWRHFATLCRIPRPSGHEHALREEILGWARQRGLGAVVDATGNLILSKPASPGHEDRPGVVLQGHLDMVCQKNAGSAHDFLRDPIRAELRDGWLVADDTTLGADNGIGVAMALAVLEADDIAHPALEVLLTVDEEAGMTGARGLQADALRGRLLINIDTEDWGEFYLGCAGGADVVVDAVLDTVAAPAGGVALRLTVEGLKGGHSGVDIHLQRGNAIKLLVRALQGLRAAGAGFALATLEGGTARNALPREAQAVIVVDAGDVAPLHEALARIGAEIADELAGVDDGFRLHAGPAPLPARVCADEAGRRALAALHAAPHGVRRLSSRVPGVVETSDNLGVVRLAEGRLQATLMVRSLLDAGTRELAAEIVGLFGLAGMAATVSEPYPGWAPNPRSGLLALFQQVYQREFGGEAAVKVIHAGLECGIFTATWPDMDMISFGPSIRGAHAPGERVEVASVERAWRLLVAVLAAVPAAR